MSFIPFVFVDGWKIISYTGEYIHITDDDLKSYFENGLTKSEIKAMTYSYLTSVTISDLQKPTFQTYEFWYQNNNRFYQIGFGINRRFEKNYKRRTVVFGKNRTIWLWYICGFNIAFIER